LPLLAADPGRARARRGGLDARDRAAALAEGEFDEIIVSTLPRRFSRWIRRDLITQVEALGLPVTTITPAAPRRSGDDKMFDTARIGGGGMLSG
jgi:hypothetical protein